MTIEKLLHCTASELEAMSDSQLLIYFEPVLKWTHVDKIDKVVGKKPMISVVEKQKKAKVGNMIDAIIKMAKQQDLTLTDD